MHRLTIFDVDDPSSLLRDLLASTAATLVTQGPAGLESTILPLVYDPEPGPFGRLSGHVARGNPVVREAHHGEALVVVTGAEGYVSPSWYPSKAAHGKVVPTWDYVTVQAAGPLLLHDDADWLRANVTRLVDRHELGRPDPWAVTDAPAAYLTTMLRGIVGVEVSVTRLAGKAKLSQNRSADDVTGVLAGLRADDPASALADVVARAAGEPTA